MGDNQNDMVIHVFDYFLFRAETYIIHVQYWSLLNWQNLQLHCGCVAVPVNWFCYIISSCYAKFKNVVDRSLVRRRVTRRLTRLQTMYNVLKFSKIWRNNVKKIYLQELQRNRNATANYVNLIMTSTVTHFSTFCRSDISNVCSLQFIDTWDSFIISMDAFQFQFFGNCCFRMAQPRHFCLNAY